MQKIYQPGIIKKINNFYKKWLLKYVKIFPKKKKKSSNDMVGDDIKFFLEMKNKGWLNIEKVL